MRSRWGGLMLAAAMLGVSPALAEEDEGDPSILDSVPALAGAKQLRDALDERGFRLSGFYFADPRANLAGGLREGATYSGLFSLALDVDFEKVAGVEGGRLHASMFQIHGKDLSERYIGNLMSVNDVGARPTTRLFELYYEQQVGDRLELQFGQMAADEEFMISEYAETFIGATLGYAAAPSENLPQEGPAYPLASLGAQATWKVAEAFTLVGAVYNATPARPDALDPQKNNPHGLNFRLGDQPLVMLEGRYRYDEGALGLPGTLKFGGYAHFGRFDHLKRGTDGLVLGSEASNGEPRRLERNLNLFAILDQQVWRMPGGDDEAGVGVFLRAIGGPADRNLINVYLDGGVVAKGVVPGRPNDVLGFAAAYANFSPRLADAERAAYRAQAGRGAVSSFETVLEATYKAEITPGLTVQPTLQYVIRPNGGPPEDGGPRIPNATAFGVTTVVTF